MTRLFLLFVCTALGAANTVAQSGTCEVPDKMKADQKLPCVRAAGFLLEQPTLTAEQLANGPDFNAADPTGSRFAYFTEQDNISCYFRPHYAFKKIKGDSMKFQSWQLTPDGAFYNRKGEPVRVDAVKVL